MECYVVNDADDEEGPVRAGVDDVGVEAVVDGEEDMRGVGEVGEGAAEGFQV